MRGHSAPITFLAACAALLSLTIVTSPGQLFAATALTTKLVAGGLSAPVFVTSPPGDHNRLFIVEQTGTIRIVKNGSLLTRPFLDVTSQIAYGGERGLLGMAFHPDYDQNGYFYVNYTNGSGDTRVARFTVSPDPDSADHSSEFNILSVDQPYPNHNGGNLAFGPNDGYLYIGLGDGGLFDDPQNNGQDSTSLLGKMLRIDVDGGSPYAVPSTNPWFGSTVISEEIWAFGLRNPWRYSFDRETGDLWIADVGQNAWEEVNFQSASSGGGENYGWRRAEGNHCYIPPAGCDPVGFDYPIHEYPHTQGCSVTGGYVYRGCAIPDLQGTYFFADYCQATIWSLRYDGTNVTDFTVRTAELDPPGVASIGPISSFGEDAAGELYIVELAGELWKIVPVDTVDCNSNQIPDGCDIQLDPGLDLDENGVIDLCQVCGDANSSGNVDIDDVVFLIAYIFQSGPAPDPVESGDSNCSGNVDIDDVVYSIAYIFQDGPPPCDPDDDGTPDC